MSGAPQAGKDVLIALLTTGYPVTVVSQSKCLLPHKVGSQILTSPRWLIPVEDISKLKSIQRKLQIPAYLVELTKIKLLNLWQDYYLKKNNLKSIFVNGFSSHSLWEKINPELAKKTILIIHESPRHFSPPNTQTVDWALTTMQKYSSLVFVSSRCRDEWLSLGKLENQKAYYIPNCCKEDYVKKITSDNKDKIRQQLGLPTEQFRAYQFQSFLDRIFVGKN